MALPPTNELHAAIRATWSGVDYLIEPRSDDTRFMYWSTGTPPTEAELRQALAARKQEATALRDRVFQTAQTAVGVQLDALTAAQVRALVAILLWKAGALDKDGNVRPLHLWAG